MSIYDDYLDYNSVTLPEFNGLPQIWTKYSDEGEDSIRIVNPDGTVEYWVPNIKRVPVSIENETVIYIDRDDGHWSRGCTSDGQNKNQVIAVLQLIKHDLTDHSEIPEFLGYIE